MKLVRYASLNEETGLIEEITLEQEDVISVETPQYIYDRIEGKYDTPDADGNPVLLHAGYPSLADQLDDIFHNGVDGWKATIQAVKDANPKPV